MTTEQLIKSGIKQICVDNGYTEKEWNDVIDMLCSKGIANGVYQDYSLLALIIGIITIS